MSDTDKGMSMTPRMEQQANDILCACRGCKKKDGCPNFAETKAMQLCYERPAREDDKEDAE